MGSRTQDECILHFLRQPIEEPYLEDPEHGAKGGIGGGTGALEVGLSIIQVFGASKS